MQSRKLVVTELVLGGGWVGLMGQETQDICSGESMVMIGGS